MGEEEQQIVLAEHPPAYASFDQVEKGGQAGDYTVDEAIEHIGMGKYQYIWIVLLGFSSMSQAVETSLASIILDTLACDWDLTLLQQALVPALVLLAAIPGDFVGGYYSDRVGRRMLIIIGQYIIAIFGVLSAFMPDYYSFLVTRCIVGFGFGIITGLCIIQVVEMIPTKYRSYAVAYMFLMWALGDCYIVLCAYLFLNDYGWRVVVLCAALPCVIMCFIIPWMDESLKYLVVSSEPEKAEVLLHKIAETNKTTMLDGKLSTMVEEERGSPLEMFNPTYRQTSICLIIAFFNSNIIYFSNVFATPYLFSTNYCSSADSSDSSECVFTLSDLLETLIVASAEFLSVPIFAVVCELLGRIKTSTILSTIVTLVLISCLFCAESLVLLIELFVTRAFIDALFLLLYIYAPECYPTYMRSMSFGIIICACNFGGACASLIVYLIGLGYSWTAMFWVLITFSVITTVTTFFFKKETLGLRLVDNRGYNAHGEALLSEVHGEVHSDEVVAPSDRFSAQ